jgi:hypothetical protein
MTTQEILQHFESALDFYKNINFKRGYNYGLCLYFCYETDILNSIIEEELKKYWKKYSTTPIIFSHDFYNNTERITALEKIIQDLKKELQN